MTVSGVHTTKRWLKNYVSAEWGSVRAVVVVLLEAPATDDELQKLQSLAYRQHPSAQPHDQASGSPATRPTTSQLHIFAGTRIDLSKPRQLSIHDYYVIPAATGTIPAWPASRPSSDCPSYVQLAHARAFSDRIACILTGNLSDPRDRLPSRHSFRGALSQLPYAPCRCDLRNCATTQLALWQSSKS